jgi:putative tryptophan/tyrosine transport system substrate-binding protein
MPLWDDQLRRRGLLALAGASVCSSVARAQPSQARRRVAIFTASTNAAFVAGMRQALREVGYEEGRNLEILERDGRSRADLIEQAAQELVRANVDVMIVWATGAAQAAMRATQRIPIVAQVADAMTAGLVKSLARPEGNITGISSLSFDISGKRVELLLDVLPRARRLAFVGLSGEPNMQRFYDFARKATRPGVEQRLIEVRGADEVEPVVNAMRADLDGITFQQIFNPHSAAFAAMTQRLKLPACGPHRSFTQAGGLMSVDSVPEEVYRRMAQYVDRLFAGATVANLPFEQATRTRFVLNLRAAASLGLTISPTLVARADEVIE